MIRGSLVRKKLGITEHQMRHWVKTGLVNPPYWTMGGSKFDARAFAEVAHIKQRLDSGETLQQIRRDIKLQRWRERKRQERGN